MVLDLRSALRLAFVTLAAALAICCAAAGDVRADDPSATSAAGDLMQIEQATADLGRAKRSAAEAVTRLGQRSSALLSGCTSGGPGWQRIRRVKHAPQRSLYSAAARRLLADMRLLIDRQQAQIVAYEPAFARFVDRLSAANVSQPQLSAAVAAQARRLAAYRQVRSIAANCQVFNRLVGRVREFPTRTAAQIVRVDYRSTPIARRIERHVSDQLRAIDRRNGISHQDVTTLDSAADVMISLGGNPGYALGFQYALSLR